MYLFDLQMQFVNKYTLVKNKNTKMYLKYIYFMISILQINFYIYIYSFSRRFYPKRLTIEEYNKRYIIKRQTDTGSACNTNF